MVVRQRVARVAGVRVPRGRAPAIRAGAGCGRLVSTVDLGRERYSFLEEGRPSQDSVSSQDEPHQGSVRVHSVVTAFHGWRSVLRI